MAAQMEFDEKDLRREISYAIKNIHGVRHVAAGGGLGVWGGGRGGWGFGCGAAAHPLPPFGAQDGAVHPGSGV